MDLHRLSSPAMAIDHAMDRRSYTSKAETSPVSDTYPPALPSQAVIVPAPSRAALVWKSLSSPSSQRYIACNLSLFAAGWNDGATGPLIPSIQKYYGISFTVVSCLFVASCVGGISASMANNHITDKLGIGKTIALACLGQCVAYSIFIPAPPLPLLFLTYSILGASIGIQDAQANAYTAGMRDATRKLNWLHGSYGLGATIAPLLSTTFIKTGQKYSHFFSTSLVVAFLTFLVILGTFRLKSEEEFAKPTETQVITTEEILSTNAKNKQIFKNPLIWITAIFLMVYVGAEVTIGGWTVTFLIDERGGGPSAGYVSSGFFGGITLGRVVLPPLTMLIGERNVIFFYLILITGLEFVVWFAPNLIANAVAVSLVGFFMGPFYPVAISFVTKQLPKSLHTGSIGFIASLSMTGSAIFPFATGALANEKGVWVLQPMLLGLFAAMALLWMLTPKVEKRGA